MLAVEVHPRAIERCPRIDLELFAERWPRVVRGPYIERFLGRPRPRAADQHPDLFFRALRQGESGKLFAIASSRKTPAARLSCSIARASPACDPGRPITIRLRSPGPTDSAASYRLCPCTAARLGRPLRFVVYGDLAQWSQRARAGGAVAAGRRSRSDPVHRRCRRARHRRRRLGSFSRSQRRCLSAFPFMAPGNHEYALRRQGAQRLFQLWDRLFVPQPLPQRWPQARSMPAQRPLSVVPRDKSGLD